MTGRAGCSCVGPEGVKAIKGEPLHTFLVADESASIHLCLWGDLGTQVRPGDICVLKLGCVTTRRGVAVTVCRCVRPAS